MEKLITLPDVDKLVEEYNLQKVTSPEFFYGKHGKYHPQGLFSEEIFGLEGTKDRRTKMAYIDLNTELIHPYIYSIIKKSNKLLLKGIVGQSQLSLKPTKGGYEIVEDNSGLTGLELFKEVVDKAESIKNINERLRTIILTYDKDLKRLLIRKVLVIPPTYRPIIYINNKPVLDPINEVYSKLIYYAERSGGSDMFGLNTDFVIMQEILWNLNDELYKSMSKKSGIIRTYMLGKRSDFTGRAVITPDPTLPPDTVGVPYKILARIAEPFIIHILMTGYLESGEFIPDMLKSKFKIPISRSSLHTILKKYSKGLILDEQLNKLIEAAIDIAVSDKLVLIKRDPALHRMSWQAVNVVPVHDDAIHFPALLTSPLNADFDGDSISDANVTLYVKNDDGVFTELITTKIDNFLKIETR